MQVALLLGVDYINVAVTLEESPSNGILNPSIGRCLLHDCFYRLQSVAMLLGAVRSYAAVTLEESPSNGILNKYTTPLGSKTSIKKLLGYKYAIPLGLNEQLLRVALLLGVEQQTPSSKRHLM